MYKLKENAGSFCVADEFGNLFPTEDWGEEKTYETPTIEGVSYEGYERTYTFRTPEGQKTFVEGTEYKYDVHNHPTTLVSVSDTWTRVE